MGVHGRIVIVGDALDLHLGSGEESVIVPDVGFDTLSHKWL